MITDVIQPMLDDLEAKIEQLADKRDGIALYLRHLPRSTPYHWPIRLKFRYLNMLDEQIQRLEWERDYLKFRQQSPDAKEANE